MPHAQPPLVHESARSGSHATHDPPAAPHVAVDGALHTLPVQQPEAQFCEHVEHAPFVQVSVGPHAVHVEPAVPHAPADGTVHALFLQQPFGHDAASQVHTPLRHCWPCAHGAFPPHAHVPLAHESVAIGLQVAHMPPAPPQALEEGAVHTPFAQHPFGHEAASQTHAPLLHSCPAAHAALVPHSHAPATQPVDALGLQAMHELPFVPHAVFDDVVQTPLAQQPFGHDAALQTHAPFTQCCPAPHAAAPPHVQAPAVQPSAAMVSQATHDAPAPPHATSDGFVHAPPEQHPLGHDALSQVPPSPAPSALPPSTLPPPSSPASRPPSVAWLPSSLSASVARASRGSMWPSAASCAATSAAPPSRAPAPSSGVAPESRTERSELASNGTSALVSSLPHPGRSSTHHTSSAIT